MSRSNALYSHFIVFSLARDYATTPNLGKGAARPPLTAQVLFRFPVRSATLKARPGGETGRRKGLKIPSPERDVRVRLPPRAPGGISGSLCGVIGQTSAGSAGSGLGLITMKPMTRDEWRAFLSSGTRTAKLATVRPDGRPHVAPVWFELDAEELVFTTGKDSVKGRNIRSKPRVMLSVDDERPPFAFVLIEGSAVPSEPSPAGLLPWTTRIAKRYMGAGQADAYGKRNAVEGELLIRVSLTRVIARKGISDW